MALSISHLAVGDFGLDAVSLDRPRCDRTAGKSEQHSLDSARSGYAWLWAI